MLQAELSLGSSNTLASCTQCLKRKHQSWQRVACATSSDDEVGKLEQNPNMPISRCSICVTLAPSNSRPRSMCNGTHT